MKRDKESIQKLALGTQNQKEFETETCLPAALHKTICDGRFHAQLGFKLDETVMISHKSPKTV
jgi:hypothetical protein